MFGVCLLLSLTLYPKIASATGWESTFSGSFTCTATGGAYTMEIQEFWLFGIKWSERVIYRDGNNRVLEFDPCQEDQSGPQG